MTDPLDADVIDMLRAALPNYSSYSLEQFVAGYLILHGMQMGVPTLHLNVADLRAIARHFRERQERAVAEVWCAGRDAAANECDQHGARYEKEGAGLTADVCAECADNIRALSPPASPAPTRAAENERGAGGLEAVTITRKDMRT